MQMLASWRIFIEAARVRSVRFNWGKRATQTWTCAHDSDSRAACVIEQVPNRRLSPFGPVRTSAAIESRLNNYATPFSSTCKCMYTHTAALVYDSLRFSYTSHRYAHAHICVHSDKMSTYIFIANLDSSRPTTTPRLVWCGWLRGARCSHEPCRTNAYVRIVRATFPPLCVCGGGDEGHRRQTGEPIPRIQASQFGSVPLTRARRVNAGHTCGSGPLAGYSGPTATLLQ